jgi:hypothetical protein
MFAKRLPLLSAFAGGCLSSAALIGFWRADAAKRPAATEPSVRQRTAETFVSPIATTSPVGEGAVPDDSSAERTAEPHGEPAARDALAHGSNAAGMEPSSQPRPEGGESPTLPSSSVADVLSHLEASYRQALAVAAVGDTPAKTGRELSSTGSGAGPRIADRELPAPQPTTVLSETPPPPVIAHEEAALARADTAAPPKKAQLSDTQVAPVADAAPVASRDDVRPRDDMRPRDDYAADTHPNIYVNNVYQGDVYQVQQLAALQYIQLLAPLAYAGLASAAPLPRGLTTRRASPFSTSLTNPDNPWGFNFRPPVLVK